MIPGLMTLPACAKQTRVVKKETKTETNQAAIDRQKELEKERQRKEALEKEFRAAKIKFVYEDIYFKKGSYRLQPDAREILKRKAEFLKKFPRVSAIIEGHTDERGSRETNIAFGDRRAGEVKSFLIREGIQRYRLIPVSYGKERPFDMGHDEKAWAKNRRAQFAIN